MCHFDFHQNWKCFIDDPESSHFALIIGMIKSELRGINIPKLIIGLIMLYKVPWVMGHSYSASNARSDTALIVLEAWSWRQLFGPLQEPLYNPILNHVNKEPC